MPVNTNPALQFIQDGCGVSEERAQELLEAGGSAERAIEIFFTHNVIQPELPLRMKRKASPTTSCPPGNLFFQPSLAKKSNVKTNEKSDFVELLEDTTNADTILKRSPTSIPNSDPPLPLQYLTLATCLAKVTGTPKRLTKINELKEFFKHVIEELGGIGHGTEISRAQDGAMLTKTMHLILGGLEVLHVSWSAVSKAVMSVTGASSSQLRQAYRTSGDAGDAAATFMKQQRLLIQPKPLTIDGVYSTLEAISKCQGKGSQTQRHVLMVKLLQSCKTQEVRFLVRTLLGNMRLGASLKTVLVGLTMAVEEAGVDKTVTTKSIQDTFDICPRMDKICLALLVGGLPHMVESCVIEVGTCISPMLANPAHSLEEVETMMAAGGPIIAEWKYDGVRCQAHWNGSEMVLYSRHMLENTQQFPDAVKFLLDAKHDIVTSFIIDSEIVGVEWDENGNKRLLPFQDLSTRRGTVKDGEQVTICIFAFDLMYLNGKSLLNTVLHERQNTLRHHFAETCGFQFASSISLETYNETTVQKYLQDAICGGAEGLMVKLSGRSTDKTTPLTCNYESGVRAHTWLKVKRDYVTGFADTIDVVPIGAWHGTGRKAERNFLSPVLLAVYDEDEDVYRSISRCMTFTDGMYESTREFYFRGTPYPPGVGMDEGDKAATNENIEERIDSDDDLQLETLAGEEHASLDEDRVHCYSTKPSALIVTNESPPIWFKPVEVWEVSFADLSLSKQHTAAQGLVDPVRGIALRFPRFKRRRPDKTVNQATTCQQIAELFAKQAKISSGTK